MKSRNLASRIGKWSAQHRRTAIVGWILFVDVAVVAGGKVGQNDLDESAAGSGESKRGDMIVDAAGFPDQSESRAGAGQERRAILMSRGADVVSRLERIKGVTEIGSPLASRAVTRSS